jgi:hypothetical protein
MPKASWLGRGNSLQRHRSLGTHLEQVLQLMQLPCQLKHLGDMPAYSRLLLFDNKVAYALTSCADAPKTAQTRRGVA